MRWTAVDLPHLSGRTAVVTGANSGIGWHTARELAVRGARVMLACRDVERAKQAADRIRSGSESAVEVEVGELDLASSASVRAFAERWHGPLHILVNNAGVMAPPRRKRTADGFELQFGTNHLGHFALTGLLLPAMLDSGAARVVTVSSIAHNGGGADVLDGNAGPYRPQRAYSNSKLANLLFAQEFQRRCAALELPVTSTAAHPGLSATGLFADPEGMGAKPLVRAAGTVLVRLFNQSAAAGARPSLYAATVAEPGSYTGPQRLHESRGSIGPASRSAVAQDEKLARRLWVISEELTGLRYPWPRR